ncbi:dlp [Drosophila busckii]|uniref:Dlp n=1 Tax=Drosophila busckii TaxID=30019 RepID=A0A0M5J8H9_DROBS|nr:dlp [Drosophila busckii]
MPALRFSWRCRATTTNVIFNSLLLLLLLSSGAAQAEESGTPAIAAAQTAALAAPGPVPGANLIGGGSSSSILDQFVPNCSAVSHIFQARGIVANEIPQKPSNERVLRYCESPSVGTCCTYNMETRMAAQSRQQLERHTKEQIDKMSSLLGGKATKFNDLFRKLLKESKAQFHAMFTRTYGAIYMQHSYVFSDLFNELENYYARGRVDLIDVMDKFFSTLYQKMFTVLNQQYAFDEKYMSCVSQHMKDLKPFGDVPDKLSVQIKRSFVATRTYGQALATAAEVSKKILNIHLNQDCTGALTKMQHCGACKGYTEKPCTNYCVNVIKGCLHYLHEFDAEWENFALNMDKVADRMLGAFNIVMVVEPINIKISEAIMNFQDSGQDITNRVFQGCGKPQLGSMGRSKRAINPKLLLAPAAAAVHELHATHAIEADTLDIDATLDEAIVLQHGSNPEFSGNPASTRQTAQISTQLFHLRNAINHLRNAYNGQDVDWSEQEEPYVGSGAGSGSGSEDDEDDDEGSGLGAFEPSHKPDVEQPAVRVNADNDDDEDTHPSVSTHTGRPNLEDIHPVVTQDHNDLDKPHGNGHDDDDDDDSAEQEEDDAVHNSSTDDATRSGGGATEKMTLRRALVIYLLPLYMAWFGGVCADLL